MFTVAKLNQWLHNFAYPSRMEKPGVIPQSLKIKGLFSSGQTLSLLRVILLFLHQFDEEDEHFQCISALV